MTSAELHVRTDPDAWLAGRACAASAWRVMSRRVIAGWFAAGVGVGAAVAMFCR